MSEEAPVAPAPDSTDANAPPPVPISTLFAGADPIEEENLGNFGEYFDVPEGAAVPAPADPRADRVSSPPPVLPDTVPAVAAPAGEGAPDGAGVQVPAADTSNTPADPPAAADPPPAVPATDDTPPVPVEGQSGAEGDEPPETSVPSYRLAQEAARRRQAEAYAVEMERRVQVAEQQVQQQVQPQVPQVPAQQPETPAAAPPAAAPPAEVDFGTDPKQMFDKVLDGDLDKATELFTSMMQKATAAAPAPPADQPYIPTPEDMQAVVDQRVQAMDLRRAEMGVIESLEKQYDVFNPSSTTFDKNLVDETLALKATYEGMQYTPADAMQRAAAMVLNMNGVNATTPTAPATPAQAPDPKAVKRNVDAQNAQPPQMPAGAQQQGTPEIDVANMSEEDFDALPEATLARYRGDLL